MRLKDGWNDIFLIRNPTRTPTNLIQVTYITCCKKFVGFQIDLFVKRESFALGTIDCRYSWTCDFDLDVDFDYKAYYNNFLEIYYDSDDNDSGDNYSSKEQTNPFTSSEMRSNLKFERFCLTRQDVFH